MWYATVGLFLRPLTTVLHVHTSIYIKICFIRKKKSPFEKFGFAAFFFSEGMNIFQHIWLDYRLLGDGEAAVCTNIISIYSTVSV